MKLPGKRKKLPLQKAVALCTGADHWHTRQYKKYDIPGMTMCDGPHGLRLQERGGGFTMLGVRPARPATCFPPAVTLAASWDEKLLEAVGRAIGEEALSQSVGLVLGPGVNIKRNPLCGRNFEYYSEDPYLAGKLAAAFVRGLQRTGVSACLKHFAANSQERDRFVSDSVIDERTLREIYLTAFEIAVKEGKPNAVMCAYNKINGVYCSDNRRLLTDILRSEWGFDGMVVTDWGAMHDRVAAFEAGCDLDMPGGHHYGERETRRAVKSGQLSADYVYRSARRVAGLAREAQKALGGAHVFDLNAHHRLAYQAACEGAVLLKNSGGLLPVKPGTKLAVIGSMARSIRYQGAGSSHINPLRVSHPVDSLPYAVYADGYDLDGNTSEDMLAQARIAAESAEVAVVFAGLPDSYESEGFDREHMRLPDGVNRLIDAVCAANENTCVVLFAGSAVECPWTGEAAAILYMGLPGQAGGEAVADLIYGRACPGGRLAESWPVKYEDVPSSEIFARTRDALYMEGPFVGYRYYSSAGVPVRWPFGYGLSYTEFTYSDLTAEGGKVSVKVTNSGGVEGSEVVQLYVSPPETAGRPVLELKRWAKLRLKPGESRNVTFELDGRCFAAWRDGWKIAGGDYKIYVGGSSASLPLSTVVHIDGEAEHIAPAAASGWYAGLKGKPDRASWEAVLGRKYVPYVPEKGKFTTNNTVLEMKDSSFVMRVIYQGIKTVLRMSYGGENVPEYRMVMSSSAMAPLRAMQINGNVPGWALKLLLLAANGRREK